MVALQLGGRLGNRVKHEMRGSQRASGTLLGAEEEPWLLGVRASPRTS
jgi:hypothetical protein